MGPGKYDKECEATLRAVHADAVLLIVLGGDRGSGFSMSVDIASPAVFANVPNLLRETARQIEESIAHG